ncbi:hypothetical protein ACWEVD_18985 [Nocardia thailandica]|uniref:hypothetical protein n=1 Tax=Nocardia thailandica TaxID=257275 RepID=UPI00030401BF|nr:hypothetical protein [Nocardia thailandica]
MVTLRSGAVRMPVFRPVARRPRLDAVSALPVPALARAFADAPSTTQADLTRLDGDLVLRSIAGTGTALLRRILDRPSFFWAGKSFQPTDGGYATGHNVFTVLGGARALPFTASVGPSSIDGEPAVLIDYDDPRVPGSRLMRRLHDEMREIEPDLWLGPSIVRTGRRRVMGWFALDGTVPFGSAN